MIDMHCHILPGIDDGAITWEDSIQMAESAVCQGIRHIIATPHHNYRNWQNPKSELIYLVDELNSRLLYNNIDLTISLGQEVRISGDLIKLIHQNDIAFLDNKKRYLLVEFPTATVPEYTQHIFYQLLEKEITPVIAHPERNHKIVSNPNLLFELINYGALAQVTSTSYIGGFGRKIQKFSKQLIQADLVHFIGSDAHNVTNRTFNFEKAFEKLEKDFGTSVRLEFENNSNKLLMGEYFQPKQAEKINPNRFFGLF